MTIKSDMKHLSKAYEKYELQWMIAHDCSLNDLFRVFSDLFYEYVKDNSVTDTESATVAMEKVRNSFLMDKGFSGSLWSCIEEFADSEYVPPEAENKIYSYAGNTGYVIAENEPEALDIIQEQRLPDYDGDVTCIQKDTQLYRWETLRKLAAYIPADNPWKLAKERARVEMSKHMVKTATGKVPEKLERVYTDKEIKGFLAAGDEDDQLLFNEKGNRLYNYAVELSTTICVHAEDECEASDLAWKEAFLHEPPQLEVTHCCEIE